MYKHGSKTKTGKSCIFISCGSNQSDYSHTERSFYRSIKLIKNPNISVVRDSCGIAKNRLIGVYRFTLMYTCWDRTKSKIDMKKRDLGQGIERLYTPLSPVKNSIKLMIVVN